MTAEREALQTRVLQGGRLSPDDRDALWDTRDLLWLGGLADERRRRVRGDQVTFVRVLVVETAPDPVPAGAGEVRIGRAPVSTAEAVETVEAVVAAAGHVPVTGFTLESLSALCRDDTAELGRLLRALRTAGLHALVSATAATPGLRDRLGVVETSGLQVGTLRVPAGDAGLRAALDEVGDGGPTPVVRTISPLAAEAGETPTTGYADVRRVALTRVLVDNIESIQVDWSLYGPKLAQVALAFGADDLDAVSPLDDASQGRRRQPREDVIRNVRAADLVPMERDASFARRDA